MQINILTVFFTEPSQGFSIFKCINDKKEEFIAKGHVGEVSRGDELIIWGEWENHKKYGQQVKITRFKVPGVAEKGILAFLQSGFVSGIGPSLAKEIYQKYKEDTVNIFDKNPEKLLDVKGIGKKKLEKIKASWEENKTRQEAVVKFQEWGIGPMTIQKIFKKWGDNALNVIQSNPYLLAWKIDNVGFLSADKIALNMGIPVDASDRIQAGLKYTLQEAATKEGHCYLDRQDLCKIAHGLLWPNKEMEAKNIRIITNEIEDLVNGGFFVDVDGKIYNKPVYDDETNLAKNTKRLLKGENPIPYSIDSMLQEYENKNNIAFDVTQKEAIRSALNNKVCIITGGPGTGKTTIVNAILTISKQLGVKENKIGLVAPTGRAAKRLEESTKLEGKTIHRYLGFSPGEGFSHNDKNQVQDDIIVCDEASMLDTYLANSLLSALPNKARLLLVGDVYQLPSVGAGNVLRDCIRSGSIPVVELNTIHRQDEGSWITRNAHAIKDGQIKKMNLTNKANDFFWFDVAKKHPDLETSERSVKLQETLLNAFQSLLKRGYKPDDMQVLTPMYKTPIGVGELNNKLQNMLNPSSPSKHEAKIGFKIFRVGDRVMQLKNDYEKDVFNGDQGKIRSINIEDNKMFINFNGTLVEYDFSDTDQLSLAYACTIHKSQGSEYPIALIPVTTSHFVMLQRNLLYTGVTRAKQMCVLAGETKALAMAVKNNKPVNRNTNLEYLLQNNQPTKCQELNLAPGM